MYHHGDNRRCRDDDLWLWQKHTNPHLSQNSMLCDWPTLLVNKLATEEVSNNTARDSGSQGKFCPARDGDRLALRMQVSLGWKSREDLLPTSLSVTEKGDGQEYSATYFTGQGSKRPRSLRFTQPLGEMPARWSLEQWGHGLLCWPWPWSLWICTKPKVAKAGSGAVTPSAGHLFYTLISRRWGGSWNPEPSCSWGPTLLSPQDHLAALWCCGGLGSSCGLPVDLDG